MHPRPVLMGGRRIEPTEACLTIPDAAIEQLITRRVTPPTDAEALLRPRLLTRLAEALQRRLTVVSAPAGFGKTTLLGQWATALAGSPQGPRVAWLTLGPESGDPTLLARALEAALLRAGALTHGPTELPAGATDLELVLARVAGGAIAEETVLILDGAEQLSADTEWLLACIVEDAPPQLHVVIATRREPALPLPRLRLRRALLELRGDDLRWEDAEAAALLNGSLRLELGPSEIAALTRATGGWVTGLCLAAISLRAHGRDSSEFSGADRFVVDYIASELLDGQPPEVQEFLLRSSALPELSAGECEALLRAGPRPASPDAPAGAQAMLEHLERHNLFLTPLDARRTRYRYQPIFAEALRALRALRLPAEIVEDWAPGEDDAAIVGEPPARARATQQITPGPGPWVEEPLSDREQQILILTAGGRANREIAEQLWISEGTVKTHLKRIFSKLGARNRTEAVAIARSKQLLPLI